MQLQKKATAEDLYDFIAEKPRRNTEIEAYMTKEIEEKGIGSVSRATTYTWLKVLGAESRVEVVPSGEEKPTNHKYHRAADVSSVTEGEIEYLRAEAKRGYGEYELKSMSARGIPTLSGREIKFTAIEDVGSHAIVLLILSMAEWLYDRCRVDVLVLECCESNHTYYKYAGLFFRRNVLERVYLNRSVNMTKWINTYGRFNVADSKNSPYGGSGKQAHDRIEHFLEEHPEITVTRDRDSLKTYEEFCETKKDEEAVMNYLKKHGYLL